MRALGWRLFGWALVLVGGFFTTHALVDIVTGADKQTGLDVLLGLAVFFGGMTFGGYRLIRGGAPGAGNAAPSPLPPSLDREAVALRLAHASGGKVGAAQLAAEGGMSFHDAEQTLSSLLKQGACDTLVTDGGAVLYRFPDLALTDSERKKAQDITE